MSRTVIPAGDPRAVKIYSGSLSVDVPKESYFVNSMMGSGDDTPYPIMRKDDLESEAGDLVVYDLSIQMRGAPTEGDDVIEGNMESLKFATDAVYIDQARKGADTGGRMTRKRTMHDLRNVARARLTEYFARFYDELIMMYGAGARGINSDFIYGLGFTGRANNPLKAPDPLHIMYGGDATAKTNLDSADTMTLSVVDRLMVRARTMGGGTQQVPKIQPVVVNGQSCYVLVISPYQEYTLRTATGVGGWLDLQKALSTNNGAKNQIWMGGIGMYNKTVIHTHENVIRFNDYGAGANVPAARALFMGRQALVMAFGNPGNRMSFAWHEESADHDNRVEISCSTIFGTKKTSFNVNGTDLDFGVIAVDTAIDNTVG
jgi:N4-gp56 family major capsid protein